MSDVSANPFDESQGHRYFSVQCFNRTWELIDKSERTSADDEQMLLRTYASMWHWTQRSDCTSRNWAVGYWQISRVHALLKQAEPARQYGELSLKAAADEAPFYIGYAHEALARAALVAGDRLALARHLDLARKCAAEVAEAEDRALLEHDLKSLL